MRALASVTRDYSLSLDPREALAATASRIGCGYPERAGLRLKETLEPRPGDPFVVEVCGES